MSQKEFIIRAAHYYEYRVTAEDADEAEQMLNEGDAGEGECTGYSVDEVISSDKAEDFDAEDERAKCVCGHLFVNEHSGLWSGEVGKYPKPNPRACDKLGCSCLDPVEAVAA
ncbi:hypothetical protein ACWENQ_08440 [Nonomuraea sp. NPDC004354]